MKIARGCRSATDEPDVFERSGPTLCTRSSATASAEAPPVSFEAEPLASEKNLRVPLVEENEADVLD
jgi:hypothetical protein